MNNEKYKLIITGEELYKEILLSSNSEFSIGTSDKSDIRLQIDVQFNINVVCDSNNECFISCDNNTYISLEGAVKLFNRQLINGDKLVLKDLHSNKSIIQIEFVMNFDVAHYDYTRVIDMREFNNMSITIGGDERYDIFINDVYMKENRFEIYVNQDEVVVKGIRCRNILYINGNPVTDETKIINHDFIEILGYSFYFNDKIIRTSAMNDIIINNKILNYIEEKTDGNIRYPKFFRNTRIINIPSDEKITILLPPDEVSNDDSRLLQTVLPTIAMLILTVVLRGVIGGGGSFVILSACTMGMGVITSICSFFSGIKNTKKAKNAREYTYKTYIEKKCDEIENIQKLEVDFLEMTYPLPQQEYQMVMDYSPDLFRCQRGDEDFLVITIGKGDVPTCCQIEYREQEKLESQDSLFMLPQKLKEKYSILKDVPVSLDLKDKNVIGVIANNTRSKELSRNIIIDIATRHYHSDVKIIVIVGDKKTYQADYYRYLPHINDNGKRLIVNDEWSRRTIYEFMYMKLSERADKVAGCSGNIEDTEFICFVLDDMGIMSHPVSKYIQNAGKYNFRFIFFSEKRELLPMGCNSIIYIDDDKSMGKIVSTRNTADTKCKFNREQYFRYLPLGIRATEDIAIKLSPTCTEEISLENTLVKSITMYELLGIKEVDRLDVYNNWVGHHIEDSMAAPIGVDSKNEIIYLDLHEKVHGPHGLVAGTTGSGKSELLQTYILSVALNYSPHEVAFLIIDFKGGGLVNQFSYLPHLIGAITNIDGKAINRSLKSIKAELRKRQECFAYAGVNHIDEYIKKYRNREVGIVLPHLIIIVDEFAELKAEQPDFMKELISASRIGRSLGVHLILATQKPAGQVSDQIWSNSRFKICLKVQSKEDSNEVLKTPLASEIKEPGRAYLQVGNNEIFVLIQSAYSGAKVGAILNDEKNFTIERVEVNGKREIVYEKKVSKTDDENSTELEELVAYIHNTAQYNNISPLPPICMPPLPEQIFYQYTSSINTDIANNAYAVPIGMYDAPDLQYQGQAIIDMCKSNSVVIGSSQYGKSNLIMHVIRYMTSYLVPEQFQFYILDFSTRGLMVFEDMKHCGGVVTSSDEDRFRNLFKMLHRQMENRKDKFVKVGATSYSSYYDMGNRDIPLITLFIDNFTAVKEIYLNDRDVLLDICRDGVSLGITVFLTNTITSAIGYKYMSNFSNKISFYCNNQEEYMGLFGSGKDRPDEIPGRCLIEMSKERYECQTYLAFEGENEMSRLDYIKRYIETNNERVSGQAPVIPFIPSVLGFDNLIEMSGINHGVVPVGLEYDECSVECLNLKRQRVLTIMDRENSSCVEFMEGIVRYMYSFINSHIYILDNDEGNLEYIKEDCHVDIYSANLNDVEYTINSVYELLNQGGKITVLIIINSIEMIDKIAADKGLVDRLKNIVTNYRSSDVLVIFSELPNKTIAFNANDVYKLIKENRCCVAFEEINSIKIHEVSPQAVVKFKKPLKPYEAYYINSINIRKIKTAKI